MANWYEALLGFTQGIAVGSGCASGESWAGMGAKQANASRNGNSQFLGAQAAQLQNCYAQAAMQGLQGQGAYTPNRTTSVFVTVWPSWIGHDREDSTIPVVKRLVTAVDGAATKEEERRVSQPESDYRPIELETHDEFSAKLAKR